MPFSTSNILSITSDTRAIFTQARKATNVPVFLARSSSSLPYCSSHSWRVKVTWFAFGLLSRLRDHFLSRPDRLLVKLRHRSSTLEKFGRQKEIHPMLLQWTFFYFCSLMHALSIRDLLWSSPFHLNLSTFSSVGFFCRMVFFGFSMYPLVRD